VDAVQVPDDARAAQDYGRSLLVGERVRLRPLAESDVPLLERWWADPEWQALQQRAVRPRPEGLSTEMFRRWSSNDGPGAAGFSVEEVATGAFAGHVTIFGAALPERAGTLAIVLGPPYVDRGLGSEAVRLMVRYGFLAMGLNRIELRTFGFNTRARRAYEGVGFVQEGVRRQAAWIAGGFADEVVMGLLRSEWDG
jgi:RimJ/RimL family protein N-acetyltransferase